MCALRRYVIPKMLHGLVLGRFSSKLLCKLDVEIRSAVRSWLHLPRDFPIEAMHTNVSEGGLGVVCLRQTIPRLFVDRVERLGALPRNAFILELPSMSIEYSRAVKLLKHQGEEIRTKLDQSRISRKGLLAKVDGKGLLEAFEVKASNTWLLSDNNFIRGRDFVDMIKCRYNCLPTHARLARGQPARSKHCRAQVCGEKETLTHVSQMCVATHGMRIKRHDTLGRTLLSSLRKAGFETKWEKRFHTEMGLRKPDIVAVKGNKTYVIDIQVVGDGKSLRARHLEKVRKYSTCAEICAALPGATYSSLTITYKGVWSKDSFLFLKSLGLSKRTADLITVQAVQGTLNLWRVFQKLVGFAHGGNGPRRCGTSH